jgi:pyruvate/2-oxoglutarate dehydrogenase complex dihydrolipoamide dehydrogenase (E3) component
MFRRFGAKVTIIDSNDHLLSREDADTSTALEEVFRNEGIDLVLSSKVLRVSKTKDGVSVHLAEGKEISGSHLLVAVGRRPNTDDLAVDKAGITLDSHGFVEVDDSYLTNVENVYAVGDATPGPQFTHVAWDDHRILFERIVNGGKRGRGDRLIPFTVFTDPHVAGVGLNEKEAREKGVTFELATMAFGDIARSIEIDETAGAMKILIDPKTEQILGVRLVGAEAGELVHIFLAIMAAKASARALVDAEFAHPTFAEGMQSLVMRLPRYALK